MLRPADLARRRRWGRVALIAALAAGLGSAAYVLALVFFFAEIGWTLLVLFVLAALLVIALLIAQLGHMLVRKG